jgi:hypothetical protein
VRVTGGGDTAQQGEVGVLPCRCSLLLSGASAAAAMKGLRWLHRRGPGTGATSAVAKGSRHGSSGSTEGGPT